MLKISLSNRSYTSAEEESLDNNSKEVKYEEDNSLYFLF